LLLKTVNLKKLMTSKNHGLIQPPTPPRPAAKAPIPRSLRVGVLEMLSGSFNYEAACKRYGIWEVKALREVELFGTILQPGEKAKIAGNIAVLYAQDGAIEFCDPRVAEEEAEAARAAAADAIRPAREMVQFAGAPVSKGTDSGVFRK
jgi:hypothetical protein